MGFWSSLGSFISKAVDVVVDTVKSVGKRLVEESVEFFKAGAKFLEVVSNVIEGVAKALGIIEHEDVEDIGDRAMRAEKRMEDFESVGEYLEYLKREIEPTPKEELAKLSPEQRLARRALGNAILARGISEKSALDIPTEFWFEAVKSGLGTKEIEEMFKRFKQSGIDPKDFVKYLKKELKSQEEEQIDSFMYEMFKSIEPELSQKEIEERIFDLQRR